jgi:hypothetical protein
MFTRYLALAVMVTVPAWAETVAYSSLPVPFPPNEPSFGYEANSINEVGDLVSLANGPAVLLSATLAMSDWAPASDWTAHIGETLGGSTLTSAGFDINLTLNLYYVGPGQSLGAAIGSYTVDAFIPWRPEPSPGCGTAWRASDGFCYNGLLTPVTFNLPYVSVPAEFIYGLAFNTSHHGYTPTGVAGPYDSLNFAATLANPSVGANPYGRLEYSSASSAIAMTSDGPASYIGEAEFDSVPEPSGMALAGIGLLGFCLVLRRTRGRLNPHGILPPRPARQE